MRTPLGAPFDVVHGIDVSADSFYSSQGRVGPDFADCNDGLLEALEARLPDAASLEMETFTLHDLARAAAPAAPIAACGAAIVVWNRHSGESIGREQLGVLEVLGGRAALEALAAFELGT